MATGTLLLDEYFAAADARFLGELLASTSAEKLKAFGSKWLSDTRPFARGAMLAYVDEGCARPFHRALVKKLFKAAETAGDFELLGHFLVAFDRLDRRRLVTRTNFDWTTRTLVEKRELVAALDVPFRQSDRKNLRRQSDAFSIVTRQYLRRRAWRAFRKLASRDPAAYGVAIRAALPLYTDEHLQTAEQFLDAWGFLHALYRESPALDRKQRGVLLAAGGLADVEPAPHAPDAWRGKADEVLALLVSAQATAVRHFAVKWLESKEPEALRGLPVSKLVALLTGPHADVRAFAARRLLDATGMEHLRAADWLALLSVEDADVAFAVAKRARELVAPSRFEVSQLVALASGPMAPAASLGFEWLKARTLTTEAEKTAVFALASARAPTVRKEASEWLVERLRAAGDTRPEQLRELLDGRFEDVRSPAFALFEQDARFRDDETLWAALAETPYPELRSRFVGHLGRRRAALDPKAVRALWATTLLDVHRGGRAKRVALGQLARELSHRPESADSLLPLLAITLRSVRAAERRDALATLAGLSAHPALAAALSRHLPDLRFGPEVVA